MRNFKHKIYFIVLCFLFVLGRPVQAEEIIDFSVRYTINQDSSINVVEDIIYDFGDKDKHGLLRDLNTNHAQSASVWYKDKHVEIDNFDVMRDGESEPFSIDKRISNIVTVKIGAYDVFVTGQQHYLISYTLYGALSYDDTDSEFYWNATGNQWGVPIKSFSAYIDTPVSNLLKTDSACYQGVVGSVQRCLIGQESNTVTFKAENLNTTEGVTIAQSLNLANITVVELERWNKGYIFFSIIAIIFLTPIVSIYWLRKIKKKHYRKIPVIAQYEPYSEISPAETGYLVEGKYKTNSLAAGIIDMANKGYISIKILKKPKPDYVITLLKEPDDSFSYAEKEILNIFFTTGSVAGSECLGSKLSSDTQPLKVLGPIKKIYQSIDNKLVLSGLYEYSPFLRIYFLRVLSFLPLYILLLPLSVFLVVYLWFGTKDASKRLSKTGYEVINYLQGFKLFLSVTDAERFKFHDNPAKNPEVFTEFLSYAIALGVEKQWVEVFKDIPIPTPTWYDISDNLGSETAGATIPARKLVDDLGYVISPLRLAGSPTSSKSSSRSASTGSSGGGFSGGGGGGGGRSW